MRGADQQPQTMFSYISGERLVPENHPLRPIREVANEALKNSRRGSPRSTPRAAGLLSRPKNCCARCSCKCSTASAASAWFSMLGVDHRDPDVLVPSRYRRRSSCVR